MKQHIKKVCAVAVSTAMALTLIPAMGNTKAYAGENSTGNATGYSRYITSNVTSLATVSGLSTIQRDDDELRLAWDMVDGASGYEVYRYSYTHSKWLFLGRTSMNTFEVEDLLSATVYKFRVRAFAQNSSGDLVYGGYKTLRTCTYPKDVDNLRATSKTTSTVTLKWSSVKRADRYQVYRYNSSTGTWKRLITTSKTTYKATGLKSGTTYKFRVRAYREALGYKYYGEYETLSVKTTSSSSTSSGLIGLTKAKQIALSRAGVSSSNAYFTKAKLDYDDGVRVYEIEFYAGNYEYELEIGAKSGNVLSYDRDYRWD